MVRLIVTIATLSMAVVTACSPAGNQSATPMRQAAVPSKIQGIATTPAQGTHSEPAIADELQAFPEIQRAWVVIRGQKEAFIGLAVKQGVPVTTELIQRVTMRTQSLEPRLQRVEVTSNLASTAKIRSLAEDLENGRPLTNSGTQFDMLTRQLWNR